MKKLNKDKTIIAVSTIIIIGLVVLFVNSNQLIKLKLMFMDCPFNHNSLKTAKILYGLIAVDEELEAKINNYDYVLGGCIIPPDKTDYVIICGKCGYSLGEIDGVEYWLKSSSNKSSFQIPLKPFISNCPIFNNDQEKCPSQPYYFQQISNNKVISEHLLYSSNNPKIFFEKHFIELANNNNLTLQKWTYPDGHYMSYKKDVLVYRADIDSLVFIMEADDYNLACTTVSLEWFNKFSVNWYDNQQ